MGTEGAGALIVTIYESRGGVFVTVVGGVILPIVIVTVIGCCCGFTGGGGVNETSPSSPQADEYEKDQL